MRYYNLTGYDLYDLYYSWSLIMNKFILLLMLSLLSTMFSACKTKAPDPTTSTPVSRPVFGVMGKLIASGPKFSSKYHIGEASNAELLTITNTSDQDATDILINSPDVASLRITNAQKCAQIKAGQSCDVSVVFTASNLGSYEGKIILSYKLNNIQQEDITISVTADVIAMVWLGGKLKIEGTKLGVHTLAPGDKKSFKITLTNEYVGKSVLIKNIEAPSDFELVDNSSCINAELAQNQSCDLDVTLTVPASSINFKASKIKVDMKLRDTTTGVITDKSIPIGLSGRVDLITTGVKATKESVKKILDQRSKLPVNPDYINQFNRDYEYQNYNYHVDNTGEFSRTPKFGGLKEILLIESNGKLGDQAEYIISNKATGNQLFTVSGNQFITKKEDFAAFDALAKIVREYGIFSLKYKNPDCYIAYARGRLFPKNDDDALFASLEALERFQDPRPLAFPKQKTWDKFKADIKDLFEDFKDPNPVNDPLKDPGPKVVVIGTGTTFVSQNPTKGQNAVLFETAPQCEQRAANPILTTDAYTFDTPTPGVKEPSDVDVHIFIPELSKLCEKADYNRKIDLPNGKKNNDGIRASYKANSLHKCIEELGDPVKRINFENKLADFYKNWSNYKLNIYKLNADPAFPSFKKGRPVNLSVHILPSEAEPPLGPGKAHFDDEPLLKTRFVIPINDKK